MLHSPLVRSMPESPTRLCHGRLQRCAWSAAQAGCSKALMLTPPASLPCWAPQPCTVWARKPCPVQSLGVAGLQRHPLLHTTCPPTQGEGFRPFHQG